MANFGNLSVNIKANITDFADKLGRASGLADQFAANLNGKTVTAMREVNKQSDRFGFNMKSISKVISGIIISQTFYRMTQAIQSATSAVWEFSQQLEYAHIAYSNLFGDISLANEFINVLKDFAATTPFSFTEAEKAAKRLVAYGIEYKNVMYVMQGVMSAASAQGDPAKVEQITRAIGQISTYGKLMTAEVRQLTEAGIPVYDILQEKLGLTQEQLRNLGKEAVPASVAINALIDGMNERFGNVVEASSKTITGIISNIKDNAVMLVSGMTEPITVFVKSALTDLGKLLFTLREIFELKGTGGVFEYLFPPEMHGVIRQFVASLGTLLQSILRLVVAVAQLLRPALHAVVNVFNILAPVVTTIVNTIATLIYMVTSNATAIKVLTVALTMAAAAWTIFKLRALSIAVITAIVDSVSKSLLFMKSVLTFVTAHPFWALLITLGAVLVGISSGFGALSEKVSNFFKSLTSFNGIDPDKVLLPSQKERANDLDKFNKKLDGTSDAMDDLADSTGKATKAAKGLLSFDEVFKLNEPDEGTDDGVDGINLDDLDLGDMDLGDAYIPEVPDLSEYINGFLSGYKDAWNAIKEGLAAIGFNDLSDVLPPLIGAGFGGLLGKLLGGKVGGIIGSIVGSIVGYFWNKLAEHFGLTPSEKAKAGVIGGVGTALGAILGAILGGPFGAKIGAIIGGIVGSFWGIFAEHLGVVDEQHFATLISGGLSGAVQAGFSLFKGLAAGLVPTFINDSFAGFSKMVGFSLKETLTGALKNGVIGAIAGLGAGILSNALTGWLANEFELTEEDLANAATGQTIGNIVGSITGAILGGPLGSIVGGVLGQLAGSIVGEFWNYISTTLKGTIIGGVAGLPIGAIVGTIVGSIGGPLGAALGALIGTALGSLVGLIVEHWSSITGFFTDIGEAIMDGVMIVVDWFKSVGDSIESFVDSVVATLSPFVTVVTTVFTDIASTVSTVISDIWLGITTVWNDISIAVSTVCNAVFSVVSSIWYLIRDLVVKVLTDIWNSFITWFQPIASFVSNICSTLFSIISTTFTNVYNVVKTWILGVYNEISARFNAVLNITKAIFRLLLEAVRTTFSNIWSSITSIVSNIYNSVSSVFSNIYSSIRSTLSNVYSSIANSFSSAYSSVKSSISNMYETVRNGIANIYNTFTNWISNLWSNVFGKFFGWIEDGIDKLREFFGLNDEASSSSFSSSVPSYSSSRSSYGHATGGIFNREHVARFAEGNKAEAIIPLENDTAMQPFVTAVADGLTASLAPLLASMNSAPQQQLQPLYVGTLIADERSLKELERKMEVIRLQEVRR